MSRPLLRLFSGRGRHGVVESVLPRRTLDDVVLPPNTRRALDDALAQVHTRDLVFDQWGLGERHPNGTALAFNFAGPSGTGKTICAEAIAHALGKRLLLVRYAELESMWFGETPKNVTAVFRLAEEEDAVLFFDEADAIAARRTTSLDRGAQRETNTVVNVLLQELERFDGVVIFATNLAVNFDPAFERRIRTHVLFELPGVDERERIWHVQIHQERTPLHDDVDFRALAEQFDNVSGGDIRNAVLKAALAAATEPGPDSGKSIRQAHFLQAMDDVLAGRAVMKQSIMMPADAAPGAQDAEAMMAQTAMALVQVRAVALAATGLAVLALALAVLLLVVVF